eukprot:4463935-Prymnesium_polylepis.1
MREAAPARHREEEAGFHSARAMSPGDAAARGQRAAGASCSQLGEASEARLLAAESKEMAEVMEAVRMAAATVAEAP